MANDTHSSPGPQPLAPIHPIWDVVQESLDEAAFLLQSWQRGLGSSMLTLSALAVRREARLAGALDGLALGGAERVDRILAPAIGSDDRAVEAVAAHALALDGSSLCLDRVAQAWSAAGGPKLAALQRGLELIDDEEKALRVRERLTLHSPPAMAARLALDSFHGRAPHGTDLVGELRASQLPAAARALLQASRFASPDVAERCVRIGLEGEHPAVRNAAIETGLMLGLPEALSALARHAESLVAGSGRLLLLWALLAPPERHGCLFRATTDARLAPAALWALGFAGTQKAADACLDCMQRGIHVDLAAEAFCAITGLDPWAAATPAPSSPGTTEGTPGGAVDAGPPSSAPEASEEPRLDSPPPHVPTVVAFWQAHRERFSPTQRYCEGQVMCLDALERCLHEGPMRRRHPIALALSIRTAGRYRVETMAWCRTQRGQMQKAKPSLASDAPRSPLARHFAPA